MTVDMFPVEGGVAVREVPHWERLVKNLESRGFLDEYWEATDPEKYPQDHLLGPHGRAVAMAADLVES